MTGCFASFGTFTECPPDGQHLPFSGSTCDGVGVLIKSTESLLCCVSLSMLAAG